MRSQTAAVALHRVFAHFFVAKPGKAAFSAAVIRRFTGVLPPGSFIKTGVKSPVDGGWASAAVPGGGAGSVLESSRAAEGGGLLAY